MSEWGLNLCVQDYRRCRDEVAQLILESFTNQPDLLFVQSTLEKYNGIAQTDLFYRYENLDQDYLAKLPLVLKNLEYPKPLMAAVKNNRPELVRLYVQNRPPLTVLPLFEAAKEGEEAVVRELIKGEAPVNEPGYLYSPSLTVAVQRNFTSTVRTLLELGADPNIGAETLDFSLYSNAARAASNDHVEILQLLIYHGAKLNHVWITPLQAAAYENRLNALRPLLHTEGIDINAKGYAPHTPFYDTTPINVALAANACDAVSLLAEAGAIGNPEIVSHCKLPVGPATLVKYDKE